MIDKKYTYKGKLYRVVGTCRMCLEKDTCKSVDGVQYQALYELNDIPQDTIFVREKTDFINKFQETDDSRN